MKCKCGQEFEPIYRNGLLASKLCILCVVAKSNAKRVQSWKKEKKELKTALKTHSEWLNELQKIFNTYIRERDKGKPCISCDAPLKGKYDAGHFFSVGAYPNIRFNEDNVHGQCVFCNQHRHGNINEYAIRLPFRIGVDRYEVLMLYRNISNKLTVSEIKDRIIHYKSEIVKLKANRVDFFEQTENDKLSNLF